MKFFTEISVSRETWPSSKIIQVKNRAHDQHGVIKYFIIKRDFQSTQDYLVKSIFGTLVVRFGETKILDRTSRITRCTRRRVSLLHIHRPRSVCVMGVRSALKVIHWTLRSRPDLISYIPYKRLCASVFFRNNIYLCICIYVYARSKCYFIQISRYRKYLQVSLVYHIIYVLPSDK